MSAIVDLGFVETCEACASTRIETGGTKRVGEAVHDGGVYEVLEFSDLTTTCTDCGYKVRVIKTPTPDSTQAYLARGSAAVLPPPKEVGELLWKGEIACDVVGVNVYANKLPDGTSVIRIEAKG